MRKRKYAGYDPQVKTPEGVGYIESEAEGEFYLIKYIAQDRDNGLVKWYFQGPCAFKLVPKSEVEEVE
jgi:hypothetical protein